MTADRDRIRRRADRERSARVQAEHIAETALLRSYERNRELLLLARVAAEANRSVSLREGLFTATDVIRDHVGFAVGHVFRRRAGDVWESTDIWTHDSDDPDAVAFLHLVQRASEDFAMRTGEGLIGRVAERGDTVWLSNLTAGELFLRRSEVGAGTVFAFPVKSGPDVVAVVEFLDPVARPPDERMIELCGVLGEQLGRGYERYRAQAARMRHLAEETAGEVRAAFLARVSHELRTPLHAILGSLEAVAGEDLDPDVEKSMVTARRAAEQLRAMVDELLEVADAGAPGAAARWERFVPADVLHAAVVPWSEDPRVSVSAVDPALLVPVIQDQDRIEAVLLALVENAIEYTDGPVEISAELDGEELRWQVFDRGPGPAHVSFDRSARPHRPDRRPGTLGLGLMGAFRAAEVIGGSLELVERPGGGLIAELTTPVRSAGQQATPAAQPLRVLVVDDSEVNLRITAGMLRRLPVLIDQAHDGLQALEHLQSQEYDLVLMDVQMPALDGLEATRRQRAWESAEGRSPVPIVAVTAHVGPQEEALCREAGMNDYLSKPFAGDELLRIVLRWIPQARP